VLGVAATALFLGLDLVGRGHGGPAAAGLGVVAAVAVLVWLRSSDSRPVLGLLRRRSIALGLIAMPMVTAVVTLADRIGTRPVTLAGRW
jgi:hypothetical protein